MPSPTVTLLEAERISKILSNQLGIQYRFTKSLCNFSRPSMLFQAADGTQKILTEFHVKQLLHNNPEG